MPNAMIAPRTPHALRTFVYISPPGQVDSSEDAPGVMSWDNQRSRGNYYVRHAFLRIGTAHVRSVLAWFQERFVRRYKCAGGGSRRRPRSHHSLLLLGNAAARVPARRRERAS